MTHRLTPSAALLLTISPMLWAGNAVVGRIAQDLIAPITLNFLRWVIAFLVLLPLGWKIFRPGSGLWKKRVRYAVLGLCGIGVYNGLQYLALHTSTPINVTLVGASMPVWMLLVGALFFGATVRKFQILGALLSILGVLIVLSHGNWQQVLAFRFVAGDLYMLVATLVWTFYSWLLIQPGDAPELRANWATFLLAQMAYGVVWSGLFAGIEQGLGVNTFVWGWPLFFILLYVSLGPAIVAFRCWGAGVQIVGPAIAGFFNNLTPLFAAVMSAAFLGETPQLYHGAAFLLIVCGIVLSARVSGRTRSPAGR